MIIFKSVVCSMIASFSCLPFASAQVAAESNKKQPENHQSKKELPDFSEIFPNIKLVTKGPMPNGIRYGYLTELEFDEIIKQLKTALDKKWKFREVEGKEFEETKKAMGNEMKLIGLCFLTHPDFAHSEVAVSFVTSAKEGRKPMLSIITNTVKPQIVSKDIPQEIIKHLKGVLFGDEKSMQQTYAKQVRLMPGHEALKPKFGIAKDPSRKKAAVTSQENVIKFVKQMLGDRKIPRDRMLKMLKTVEYAIVKVNTGDVAIAPSDPVGTPDGKLHFLMIKGDKLIKATRLGSSDYLLFQLRKIEGKWKVVAEYFD